MTDRLLHGVEQMSLAENVSDQVRKLLRETENARMYLGLSTTKLICLVFKS